MSVVLSDPGALSAHHPVGISTGYVVDHRGDWPQLVEDAIAVSSFAVELAALSEGELPGLLEFLAERPSLPFRYVSVHGPSKDRVMSNADLAALLAELPLLVDSIVLHSDSIGQPSAFGGLGSRAVIENMDARKHDGRTVEELERTYAVLPEAGFCLDVAHAWSVDPSSVVAHELLDAFAPRLRHVHISSLATSGAHVPLTSEDENAFGPVLARCRDVPWILEAPLRDM